MVLVVIEAGRRPINLNSIVEFDKSGFWHFAKDRIRHELEITLKENELCPALDRKRVLKTLEKLPNSSFMLVT